MKKKCESLRHRYKEIEVEHAKLENFKFAPTDYQEDVVKGSDTEYPYTERHIKIQGIGNVEYPRKKEAIAAKIARIRREIEEVEEYIASIDDVEMRNILTMYYELGMTQDQIANQYGYERSTISKKMKEFWADK